MTQPYDKIIFLTFCPVYHQTINMKLKLQFLALSFAAVKSVYSVHNYSSLWLNALCISSLAVLSLTQAGIIVCSKYQSAADSKIVIHPFSQMRHEAFFAQNQHWNAQLQRRLGWGCREWKAVHGFHSWGLGLLISLECTTLLEPPQFALHSLWASHFHNAEEDSVSHKRTSLKPFPP